MRIVSGAHGTAAVTRVLVETSDGVSEWDTVGRARERHRGLVAALEDAYTVGLLRRQDRRD